MSYEIKKTSGFVIYIGVPVLDRILFNKLASRDYSKFIGIRRIKLKI